MEQRDSFVFYRTFKETVDALPTPELKLKLYDAIISYGLTGEYDESDAIVNAMMKQTCFAIDRAQENYAKAVSGGKKGGARKKFDTEEIKELLAEGKTHAEVAKILGCSSKTVQRAIKEESKPEFEF